VGGSHGRPSHHPLAENDAKEVKRTGRWTWRPERVVLVADISEEAVAGFTDREREREKKVGGVVRETTVLEGGVIET
jgi:hypothetical protein